MISPGTRRRNKWDGFVWEDEWAGLRAVVVDRPEQRFLEHRAHALLEPRNPASNVSEPRSEHRARAGMSLRGAVAVCNCARLQARSDLQKQKVAVFRGKS